jgi:hypothetical protein
MLIESYCLPDIFNSVSFAFSEIVISLRLKGYITNNNVVEGLFVEAVKLSLSVFNDYSPPRAPKCSVVSWLDICSLCYYLAQCSTKCHRIRYLLNVHGHKTRKKRNSLLYVKYEFM